MSELLTVSEVAHLLRVDAPTVRRLAKQGTLGVVVLPHVGGRPTYRIKRASVDKVMEDGTHK